MLCFMDKTFCASKTHKDCGREITKDELARAKKLKLPIAWGYFCGKPNLQERGKQDE